MVFGEDPETTFWDVSGVGGFEGTVQGRWPALVIEGEVEGQSMRFSTIHAETLTATARIDPDTIRIESLSARAGAGRLSASDSSIGAPASTRTWSSRLSGTCGTSGKSLIFWSGTSRGTASSAAGAPRCDASGRSSGSGNVVSSGGMLLEQPFDELSIAWNLDGESVRLAPLTAVFRRGSVEGALDLDLVGGTMEGSLTGRDYPLAPGLAPEWISLRSDFRVDIGGDLLVPELLVEGSFPAGHGGGPAAGSGGA